MFFPSRENNSLIDGAFIICWYSSSV